MERDFYVACAHYNGFDETERTMFPDMPAEIKNRRIYPFKPWRPHLRRLWLFSGRFFCWTADSAELHSHRPWYPGQAQGGGLSARLQAVLIARMLHGTFQKGRLPGWMQKRLEKKSPEDRTYLDHPDPTIHIKMCEKCGKRYRQHFKAPDIRCHDMQHEELLVCYPEQWAEEIKKSCEVVL